MKTSVMLGIIVFALVAIGLSFLDDRVKSAWDIEGFIGAHLLGIIPELGDVPDTEKHSLVNSNRTSPGSEAFLSVYSAVKIQSKLDFPKAVLVTSTIPGEGKTMISCNLAASFARHGKRLARQMAAGQLDYSASERCRRSLRAGRRRRAERRRRTSARRGGP